MYEFRLVDIPMFNYRMLTPVGLQSNKPLSQIDRLVAIVGATGPAGQSHDHAQPTPSTEWIVNHNLGVRPSVAVVSPGGIEVKAGVHHQSLNQVRLSFAEPQTGFAHCV